MSMIDDLLAYATQQAPQSGAQPVSGPTGVEGLTVTPPPRKTSTGPSIDALPIQKSADLMPPLDAGTPQTPQPAGLNYDNSGSVNAVNQSLGTPRGGMANPGVYGVLPQGLQHGTLRNMLGALGDAFLVGSGRQPQYEPRMQRQELGNAMAGMDINDPQSVAAAVQRVAATGATGAPELADKLQQQAEQAALRKQYMQYNQDYRNQVISSKNDSALARMTPYVGGMVNGAKDKASYAAAYQRAEAIAQRIGSNYHASDFGLPDPADWQPGMTATTGMTSNNVQQSTDKAAQRDVSQSNNAASNRARVQAAGVAAGGHVQAAGISAAKATEGTIMQSLIQKQNSGQPLTPAEQAFFSARTQTRGGRSLPPGLTVGGGAGAHAPAATDINYLRAHPQARAQFDAHFGAGASARYLGH